MLLDLALISELCRDVRLKSAQLSTNEVALCLEPGVTLLFRNSPENSDCLVGFEGTPWHTHGRLTCSDRDGRYVELTYLDIVSGLADGMLLICELWARGKLSDRWLVHRNYVDEFKYLQKGDEIRIRSAAVEESAHA
jgi:hypothetical protein